MEFRLPIDFVLLMVSLLVNKLIVTILLSVLANYL